MAELELPLVPDDPLVPEVPEVPLVPEELLLPEELLVPAAVVLAELWPGMVEALAVLARAW